MVFDSPSFLTLLEARQLRLRGQLGLDHLKAKARTVVKKALEKALEPEQDVGLAVPAELEGGAFDQHFANAGSHSPRALLTSNNLI